MPSGKYEQSEEKKLISLLYKEIVQTDGKRKYTCLTVSEENVQPPPMCSSALPLLPQQAGRRRAALRPLALPAAPLPAAPLPAAPLPAASLPAARDTHVHRWLCTGNPANPLEPDSY